MKPEPGNKNIQVTRADVAGSVRGVGVKPGDIILFHSSLSSMGTVVGGPNTVIDGFLDAVGPDGTLAVPTLWAQLSIDPPSRLEEWDIDASPSYPGLVTEVLRRRPDSLRSNNPSHSVSAIGARAEELTRTHGQSGSRPSCFSPGAFAEDSPWQKLYDWNAWYAFIGVDFTVCTMRHFVECRLVEEVLAGSPPDRRDRLRQRLSRWMEPGVWPSHNGQAAGQCLERKGLVRVGKIGSATLRAIRSRDLVDNYTAVLRAEPRQWFTAAFMEWLAEAGAVT